MKLKKLGLVLTTVLTLFACGEKENTKSNELKILVSWEPIPDHPFIKLVDRYSEETGIEVELNRVPENDLLAKFPAMVRAGDAPDIVYSSILHKTHGDILATIPEEISKEKMSKNILRDYMFQNELKGFPIEVTSVGIFYNVEAFKSAGIEVPKSGEDAWSWNEFEKNLKQVMNANSDIEYGLAVDYSWHRLNAILYQHGGSITQGGKVVGASKENMDALDRFKRLHDEGVIPMTVWGGGGQTDPKSLFVQERAATYLSGSWNIRNLVNEVEERFDFEGLPTPYVGDISNRASIQGGAALMTPQNRDGEMSNAALNFITWFYGNTENIKGYLEEAGSLSMFETLELDYPDDLFNYFEKELSVVPEAFYEDEDAGWRGSGTSFYFDELVGIVTGRKTSEAALDDAAASISHGTGLPMVKNK